MTENNFSSWPSFTVEESNAVQKVLLSNKVNYWTGDECRKFEKEFADWVESKYAVALANGSLAIEASLKALNITNEDEVIVTSRTFIATVSAIINVGAKPIFADIDRSSQNIAPEFIKALITEKTKAIICVHLAGWPCEMDEIMTIAKKHKLYVVEDCAQAHGAKYKGKSIGSIGHIGCWSFCQDKIMTTGGEGGMVTTNDELLWRKIWAYKDHGKSYEAIYERRDSKTSRLVHESFGTNCRMTEMQAAIGRIQLKNISYWHKKRLDNANSIWNTAKKCKIFRVPAIPDYIEHACYKCYIFVEGSVEFRDKIMREINEKGVPCYSGSCSEVYIEKAFDNTGFRPKERLTAAKELGEKSLMFLVHPTLKEKEIKKTCDVLIEVAEANYEG